MEKKYPEIVYKYRSWSNEHHKKVLLKNELYLSSPKDFNDPFDCRIPENFYLLDTKEKRKKYIDLLTNRHSEFLQKNNFDIKQEMERIENRLANELDLVQQEQEENLFKNQDVNYGVLALSATWENVLLWSHYAENHKGFCVGFVEEKLRNSGLFGVGGDVIYDEVFPSLNPLESDFHDEQTMITRAVIETHTKAKDWEYEKEYRLTKLLYPQNPSLEDRIVKIPDNFFAEIVIGLNMCEEYKKDIINIAKQKNIKVFQAKKIPFRFAIQRHEIN